MRRSEAPIDSFQSFGDALKFFRKRSQLTQEELARAVGYSREQITLLESGRRKPDPTTVAALFLPVLELEGTPAARLIELAESARKDSSPQAPAEDEKTGPEGTDRAAYREAAEIAELAQGDLVEAARQYFLAGDFKEAADVLMDQGSILSNQGRADETAALIDEMIGSLRDQPDTPPVRNRDDIIRRLLVTRGDVLLNTARAAEAEENFREAMALATGAVRTTLIYRLAVSLTQRGRAAEALSMIQQAFADLPPQHLLIRAQLKLVEGGALVALSRLSEAEQANLETLALADQLVVAMPLMVASIRARANNSLGAINAIFQRHQDAIGYWKAAVETARLAGIRVLEYLCQGNIANLLFETGDLAGSAEACNAAIEGLKSIGSLQAASKFVHLKGCLLYIGGKLEEALPVMEEACQIKQQIGDRNGLMMSLNQQAKILLAMGRIDEMHGIVEQAMLEVEQLGDHRMRAYTMLTLAERLMLSGEIDEAHKTIISAMALPGVGEDVKLLCDCCYHLIVVLLAAGDVTGASNALDLPPVVEGNADLSFERELVEGALELARGNGAAARSRAEQLANAARHRGYLIFELRAQRLIKALSSGQRRDDLAAVVYGSVASELN
jgi:tetratricopeptide (TPR) repeat protein